MSTCSMMGGPSLNPLFWIGVAGVEAWYAFSEVCSKISNTGHYVANSASNFVRNIFFKANENKNLTAHAPRIEHHSTISKVPSL